MVFFSVNAIRATAFSQTRAGADVSQHCYAVEPGLAPSTRARSWACHRLTFLLGARYANVYDRPPPTTTREAWIEPLSSDAATALVEDRSAHVNMTLYRQVRGRARVTLFGEYPDAGIVGDPIEGSAVRWSILPLRPDDLARLARSEVSGRSRL
jgi:hypothetical protein